MSQKYELFNPFTMKISKIKPYGRTARRIYHYYLDLGLDPENILPPLLTYQNGRLIKKKPLIDWQNVRRLTYQEVHNTIDNQLNYVRDIFKTYAGSTIEIAKKYTKKIAGAAIAYENSAIIDIPPENNGFSSWWSKWSVWLWLNSEQWIFSDSLNEWDDNKLQAQLLFITLDKVGQGEYKQYFLDGISHCFFTPIKEWAHDCQEEAKSKSAKNRYKLIIKKINKYLIEYKGGVPEADISHICNNLQIGIEIDLPSTCLKDTKYIEITSQKKALKKFRFINTRLNHIEINDIRSKDNYIEITKDELEKIYNEARNNDDFIMWKGSKQGIHQINLPDKIYKLTEDEGYNKECRAFEDANNLRDYKIEHFGNKSLSKFLLNHINCNQSLKLNNKDYGENNCLFEEAVEELSHINILDEIAYRIQYIKEHIELFDTHDKKEHYWIKNRIKYKEAEINCLKDAIKYKERIKNMKHIDLRKAYTRGAECIKYQGYLGKIHDFRKTNKIMGLGIYMIKNIIFNDNDLIKNMGILYDNNSYPSPELEYYNDLGITFDIVLGAWGSSIDIDFSYERVIMKKEIEEEGGEWTDELEEEYEDRTGKGYGMYQKEDDISHFCKWYGCLMKLTKKDRYSFACKNLEFAKLNCSSSEEIGPDIRYNQYREEGIIEYKKKKAYHSAHIATFINSYARISMLNQLSKFKNIEQILAVQVDGIYYDGEVDIDTKLFAEKPGNETLEWINNDCYIEPTDYCLEDFDGGCMGTIADNRINNMVEVHAGAGGNGKTHYNIIDKGLIQPIYIAPSWKLARKKQTEYGIDSSVFFYLLDDDPDRYLPILRYYNTIIIDEISMLSNEAKIKIMKRFHQHKIIFCGDIGYQLPPIEGTEFKIGNLPIIKHKKNYRCKCPKLAKILKNLRKTIRKSQNIKLFNIHQEFDMAIIDKDNINYQVHDLILSKTHKNKDKYTEKYKELDKFIVLENTRDFSNGDIIIGPKPKKVKAERRHAYTVHSIQGETAENKLFIDMNKMNDLRMFYTALSRARFFHQIVLIQ